MKLNISNPSTGGQKMIEVEDDTKLRAFYDKRISHEVDGDVLGDDFKGYVFRIGGGNDKEGFPMLQGVLTAARVRLLFHKGMPCYRPRKRGERKRKSVRGCIVSSNLAVLSLVIVKKGEKDIPGLTDDVKPRRLGPKRASKIRKLFNLEKKDDVRQYVVRRQIVPKEGKKPTTKAPKIQRLITPQRLQRKRERKAVKKQRYEKSKKEAEEYNTLLSKRVKEQREKRKAVVSKKRSLSRLQSGKEEGKDQKKDQKKEKQPKAAKETVQKPAAAKQTPVPASQQPKPTSTGAPQPKPQVVPAKPQPQAQPQAQAPAKQAAPAKADGDAKKKKKKKGGK